jgi:hypothetical protein
MTIQSESVVFGAKIELQPHQKIPVEYLQEHPDQKGLLLFHSLGSGKTYVALDYAEKNPDKKVLILLPEFLKSNWITQMKSYGVKDPSRYEMVSLEEPEKMINSDLSNTIVIVDEVHKLVQRIKFSSGQASENIIRVYEKVRSAQKILLLTGTPIFVDTSDLAYIANLFDSEDRYPVDPIRFRTEYMRIKPVTSLVRGHVTESKLMMVAVPFFVTLGAVVTLGTALPWAIPLVALGGSAVLPVTNEIFPVSQVSFREFDTDRWKDFSEKYISYYHVKLAENKNYPSKVIYEKKVEYNDPQVNFFLSFVDEDLNPAQLRIMLSENKSGFTDSYLKFHSSRLQKQLLSNPTSGMEIGNLDFKNKKNQLIESPKFIEVLNTIKRTPGKVAIYSNYFVNGTQRFASFLDRHGMKDQYIVLSPSQSTEEQMAQVDQYNRDQKKILLIHPEITEGISLIGTEQFHILEPIRNATLLEQVIGRSIRYQSHIHLPKERQVVRVYLWESGIDYSHVGIPTSAGLLRREHWQKNYSEVNPSMWSKGILEVDSNYFLKDETPDQRVKRHKSVIQKDVESFQDLLENHSIEKI